MEPYGGALTRGERSVVPHTVVQCCSADTTHRFYLLHIHLYLHTYVHTTVIQVHHVICLSEKTILTAPSVKQVLY